MAPSERPLVSIGMPVYQAEAYLVAALTGLQQQTYENLEIIVSDNGSSDSSLQILSEFARNDPRIRVHRFARNMGPAANYNKVAELATGEFFMWAAADDEHAPTFVERCVANLQAHPEAVLAYGRTRIIDGESKPVRDADYEPDVNAPTAAERLDTLVNVDHHRHGAFEIFSLMRRSALMEVLPQGAYARSDSVILVRMALRGTFLRSPEFLFFNRDHGDRSVRTNPTRSYGGRGFLVRKIGSGPLPGDEWWDASRRFHPVWPEWKLLAEYRAAVEDAPLSQAERAACRKVLRGYAVHHVPKMGRDVLLNTEFVARRALGGRRGREGADVPRSPRSAPTETLLTFDAASATPDTAAVPDS